MKSFTFFGTCLMMALVLPSTSGTFPWFFNFPSLANPTTPLVNALSSSVSALEAALGSLRFQFPILSNQLSSLANQLATLTNQFNQFVAGGLRKCPPTAPASSKVVGSYCYYVSTTPNTFDNARADCNSNGAILAEPLFSNSQAFYSSILTAFPSFSSVSEIWIGLHQLTGTTPSTSPFTYLSNNVQVAPTTTTFTAAPTTNNVQNAAVLVAPGTGKWTFYDITTTTTTSKAYICQFNTVL